jgi:hypothetical protein
MLTDLVQIGRLGEKKREENRKLRVHMKTHGAAERRLRRIAERIEDEIDCTACANCCRVATVRLRERELDSLARHIGVSRREFARDYAEKTEQGWILKRTGQGCVFLEGNLCSVYEARPMTCEDFPHLARGEGSLVSRMWEMPDRATYCPIAYNTLEAFKGELGVPSHK